MARRSNPSSQPEFINPGLSVGMKVIKAIFKIVFGVFVSGFATDKHINPLVFEMTSRITFIQT
jgi:hypothetical protein